jgi:hypothetical protein
MTSSPAALAITNGTVVDGTGAGPISEGMVLVEGNRIAAVGRVADMIAPPDAAVVDAKGGTILPGIVDAHVHGAADPAVRRQILTGGVTSVCDLGSPKGEMPCFERDDTGQGPAARGFRAGPVLTAPGGCQTRSWVQQWRPSCPRCGSVLS